MNEIKIGSRTDWLLDSCYYNCFVCGKPFSEPPRLHRNGTLEGRVFCLSLITEEGGREDTEERICNSCWVSDLSRFFENEVDLTK